MAELASFYGQDGTVGQVLRRTDRRLPIRAGSCGSCFKRHADPQSTRLT